MGNRKEEDTCVSYEEEDTQEDRQGEEDGVRKKYFHKKYFHKKYFHKVSASRSFLLLQ